RNRWYEAERGRWIQRDPKGMYGDAANRGNAYGALGGNPNDFLDPFGLEKKIPSKWDILKGGIEDGLNKFRENLKVVVTEGLVGAIQTGKDLASGKLSEDAMDAAEQIIKQGVREGVGGTLDTYATGGKITAQETVEEFKEDPAIFFLRKSRDCLLAAGSIKIKIKLNKRKRIRDSKKSGKPVDKMEPGPYAEKSIPSKDGKSRDFSDDTRGKINKIGCKDGCHSCGSKKPGTKSGDFIPDHQPPNAVTPNGVKQRLYPHCKSCSGPKGRHAQIHQARAASRKGVVVKKGPRPYLRGSMAAGAAAGVGSALVSERVPD
ncbi:hypothetical protein JYT15_01125, partial [Acidimicrobium ferrooxidans]|nr:hypothetical protein [Acidimicrobium ferrooxidans]